MPILVTSQSLPKRTQRGGKDFDRPLEFINEYALLFIDEAAPEQANQVAAELARKINRMPDDIRDLPARINRLTPIGKIIGPISEFLCRTWQASGIAGGCTETTISAEIAKRKNTTVQGAHAWMIRPLLFGPPLAQRAANFVLETEAEFACQERGPDGINEMIRFLQNPLFKPERNKLEKIQRRCRNG